VITLVYCFLYNLAKAKKDIKKPNIDNDVTEAYTDYTKLGELLKIDNDDTILADWQGKITQAIGKFLNDIKHRIFFRLDDA
jgi:putative IMPACT (imprinted ancient) family translation regulator